jgi:hypothetical protein
MIGLAADLSVGTKLSPTVGTLAFGSRPALPSAAVLAQLQPRESQGAVLQPV